MLFVIIWVIVITMTAAIIISSPTIAGNPIKMGITGGILFTLYLITYIFVKCYITIEPINEQLIIIQQPILDNIPLASAVIIIHEHNFIDTPINKT